MKSTTFRKNLLAVAIAGVFSMPVMAQDQQESTADDQKAEKVADLFDARYGARSARIYC